MKLRKMITVSAAALMLAGVGASATNAGVPVHASRRTVQVTRLGHQRMMLNRQIRRDQNQVKRINREISRLSHKNVRRSKRSKRTVKRNKRVKNSVKRSNGRNAKVQKLTPQQKALQQQLMKQYRQQMEKQRLTHNLVYGQKVYRVTFNGLGKPLSKKYLMTLNAFILRNREPAVRVTRSLNNTKMQLINVVKDLNKALRSANGNKAKIHQITQTKQYNEYVKLRGQYEKLMKLDNNYLLYRPVPKKVANKR